MHFRKMTLSMVLRANWTKRVRAKVCSHHLCKPTFHISTTQTDSVFNTVVQSWAQSKSSEPPCSMQSFPATNRQALKNGCITPKAQREYGKEFPVMKQNPKQSNKKSQNPPDEDLQLQRQAKIGEVITSIYQESTHKPHQPPQAFGILSKKNKVSMTELLRCIPAELDDETDYPDLSGKKRKGRLPPAKATKSSLIVAKCREPPSKEETEKQKSVETFKIKRFQNVRPRVKCT